ncbi:type 4a pilus biogenesis protein PilO [Oceanobacillus sp. M65]|uniref:type 4a pilus biogenesis protein PilO n=1 Tax=Oceanobacillus sp. M65 TaxID=3457435 RepID=UPI003FCCEBBC
MMKSLNKKHIFVLVGSLIVLGLVYLLGYQLMVKPQKSEADSLHSQVSMFEKQVTASNGKTEKDVTEDFTTITQLVPDYLAMDSLLREIQKLANSNDIRIDYIGAMNGNTEDTDVTEEETTGVEEATYTMEVTGKSVEKVNQFLDALLEGERLITIETLNLNQDGDSLFASISFSTYYAE